MPLDSQHCIYNAANQITSDVTNSFTYDNSGNLIDDGVNEYTWDRANRLLEVDNGIPAELTAYAYDGVGNRISQAIGTASPVVTQYLLDTQPGLTKILAQTIDGNTDRFIHSQRGILAHQDNSGDWFHPVQDGLGSVRSIADDVLAVQGMQHYTPYGSPFGVQGTLGMPFGFTGEQTDANELVYLRARYLNPVVGAFVSLDPFEGIAQRPMSLNGYGWVEGNVVNGAVGELIFHNRYSYANNNPVNGAVGELIFHNRYSYANSNPVNLTDPNGMQACFPGGNCTTPSSGDIFIPDVGDGFSNVIIPPNWGDLSPEDLLNLCTCLNSGMCSFQCNSILGYWTGEGQAGTGTRTFPPMGGLTPEEWIALLLSSLAGISTWLNLIRSLPIERVRPRDDTNDECRDGVRRWRRIISIPESVTPGSIVSTISTGLGVGMPPFHAGQPTINKRDVECLASGMQQGYARMGWYHFTFGRYTGGMRLSHLGYDPNNYLGEWVLTDGHHRLIAWLISGVPPLTPSVNRLGVPANVFPWWAVRWGL